MKTMFAALASALLVSTAFAQTTAAPAPSMNAATSAQPGQANLKASTAQKDSMMKADAATDASGTSGEKAAPAHRATKKSVHMKKANSHKTSKKNENATTGANNDATPATGGAKADTATKAE